MLFVTIKYLAISQKTINLGEQDFYVKDKGRISALGFKRKTLHQGVRVLPKVSRAPAAFSNQNFYSYFF